MLDIKENEQVLLPWLLVGVARRSYCFSRASSICKLLMFWNLKQMTNNNNFFVNITKQLKITLIKLIKFVGMIACVKFSFTLFSIYIWLLTLKFIKTCSHGAIKLVSLQQWDTTQLYFNITESESPITAIDCVVWTGLNTKNKTWNFIS